MSPRWAAPVAWRRSAARGSEPRRRRAHGGRFLHTVRGAGRGRPPGASITSRPGGPDERAPVGELRPRVVADELRGRPDLAARQRERRAVVAPAAVRAVALLLVAGEPVLGPGPVARDLHAGGEAAAVDAGLRGGRVVPVAHQRVGHDSLAGVVDADRREAHERGLVAPGDIALRLEAG